MHTRSATGRPTAWAGAAVLAALVVTGCGAEQDEAPEGGSASAPAETRLTVQSDATAKCAVPSAEILRTQEIAFEGTVTEVADGTATLEVEEWFRGEGTDTVVVETPSQQLQDLLLAVNFQEGRTYLVSATDGQVTLCGFTAEKGAPLDQVYADAFGE